MIDFNKKSQANTANSGVIIEDREQSASVGFMKKTYQLLALSMVVAALGAYLTMPFAQTIHDLKWVIFGVELAIIFFGFGMVRNKPDLQLGLLFVFTFITGVSLVPLFGMLIGAGKGALIGNAFLMTSVLFGALSMFAINSKQDFSSWGKPLFITVIVLIVLSIMNVVLFNSPIMHVIISAVVLLVFSLFTIYDTQNIANGAYDSPVEAALSLYLDFFNMFVSLLQLLGIMGNDE
ncbi:MAG: Bax inhibitor-1/YccA family protein [Campylobacterales bacterium]|nr:Bax inhibitor-1/YccA family protein [Campylobacterales bacterium]